MDAREGIGNHDPGKSPGRELPLLISWRKSFPFVLLAMFGMPGRCTVGVGRRSTGSGDLLAFMPVGGGGLFFIRHCRSTDSRADGTSRDRAIPAADLGSNRSTDAATDGAADHGVCIDGIYRKGR